MDGRDVAGILLDRGAVALNAKEPYTFVSGIRSPIYCDNRRMLAFPVERDEIVDAFVEVVGGLGFDVLAGTATAGIPWASFLAQRLKKPLAYVRGEKKEHGKGKRIEGAEIKGKRVIVIEDLISTGGSSISAVEAAREAGGDVLAVVAIFTYEFESARKRFEEAGCDLVALSNLSTLVEVAGEKEILRGDELALVMEWSKDPEGWGRG